jgi:pyruvate dehydrogenase (quinone)
MSKRVADLVIETLQAAGVRSCYDIVGDTLNRIAHSIDRSKIDGGPNAPGRAATEAPQ